jgi:hypothetical protein
MSAIKRYHEQITETSRLRDIDKELARRRKVPKKPTDWVCVAIARSRPLANEQDHESAHPSHFLTTRDAKPRLFPFPLGKAGGQATKGELWWEAGNAAHV